MIVNLTIGCYAKSLQSYAFFCTYKIVSRFLCGTTAMCTISVLSPRTL